MLGGWERRGHLGEIADLSPPARPNSCPDVLGPPASRSRNVHKRTKRRKPR